MNLVNGYYCVTCADEALAKQGIDPSSGIAKTDLQSQAAAKEQKLGINAPEPNGELGTRLDLYA